MIPGRFLLFIGRLVFLIDHDEAEIFQGREDRAARADHDARPTGMDLVPFIMPFALGQMAVQHGDRVLHVGKTAFEPLDRLRGQRNLWNQNDSGASAVERGADRLQINFRFPRAGDAVEQNRARVLG